MAVSGLSGRRGWPAHCSDGAPKRRSMKKRFDTWVVSVRVPERAGEILLLGFGSALILATLASGSVEQVI